jgi:uncharacterized protein (DUF952 family)
VRFDECPVEAGLLHNYSMITRHRHRGERMTALIYKIHPAADWAKAEQAGVFHGAPIDLADGYIHFSTGQQARDTAAKHFAGQAGLLLIAVDAVALGPALVWEPSRGGALFPHLYGLLDMAAVRWLMPLPLLPDGSQIFPPDVT